MKNLFKSIVFKNIAYLSIIQALTYLTPLIVIPHLYKFIGIEKYGLFSFSNSFIFYFTLIVDFGFQLYVTKEISIHRNDKEHVNRLFTVVYFLKFILLIIAAISYFLIIGLTPFFYSESAVYHYAFLQVLGFFFLPIWLFQGFERIGPLTIINAITRFAFLIGCVLLVRSPESYRLVQLLNSLSIFLYGLISFAVAIKIFKIKIAPISRFLVLEVFYKSSWYFGSRIATSLYTVSNTILLGVGGNNYYVGIYSVAERFYFAIQNLLQPVTSAIYPYISSTKNIQPVKKYFLPAFSLFVVGCVAAAIVSEDVFPLLIKNIRIESITVFQILCVVLVVTFPSIVLGYPVTSALGHDKLANIPIFIAAAFHIFCLFVLFFLDLLTPVNVAFLLLFTEAGLLLMRIFIIRHLGIFNNESKD